MGLWWLAPVKFLLPEDAEPRVGVGTKQSQEKIVGVDRLQVERCHVPLAAGRQVTRHDQVDPRVPCSGSDVQVLRVVGDPVDGWLVSNNRRIGKGGSWSV